jgi:hypothetical protein
MLVAVRLDNRIIYVNEIIHNQRSGLRFQLWLASTVVSLGFVLIMLAQLLAGRVVSEDLKWLLTLGGTFFSSLSSLPIKEIFAKRDRISLLEYLLREFNALDSLLAEGRDQEVTTEQHRLDDLLSKVALGAS